MAARIAAGKLFRNLPSTGTAANLKAVNFSTTAETKGMTLKNRPLSPFLSQKRPEKSSTLSIGERFALIVIAQTMNQAKQSKERWRLRARTQKRLKF